MGLLDFDVGAWGACLVLAARWSNRWLGSGRLHRFEQGARPRRRWIGCDSLAATVDVSFAGAAAAPRQRTAPVVDAHQRKQCAAERLEAYAAFRLAMTCLKSVTNST
jgi:hypothetical protein